MQLTISDKEILAKTNNYLLVVMKEGEGAWVVEMASLEDEQCEKKVGRRVVVEEEVEILVVGEDNTVEGCQEFDFGLAVE